MPKLQLDLLDPALYRTIPHELRASCSTRPDDRDQQTGLWALAPHRSRVMLLTDLQVVSERDPEPNIVVRAVRSFERWFSVRT